MKIKRHGLKIRAGGGDISIIDDMGVVPKVYEPVIASRLLSEVEVSEAIHCPIL